MNETTPTLVRLIQCGRRSCSYVLTDDERDWTPNKMGGESAVCPKCGDDAFYTLKENGQKVRFSERDEYLGGIDPNKIEATPRMGPKMRKALQGAKARALAHIKGKDPTP